MLRLAPRFLLVYSPLRAPPTLGGPDGWFGVRTGGGAALVSLKGLAAWAAADLCVGGALGTMAADGPLACPLETGRPPAVTVGRALSTAINDDEPLDGDSLS